MNMSEAGKLGHEKSKEKLAEIQRLNSQKLIDAYTANPKCCRNCGTLIPFEKRRNHFCNKTCAAVYNNTGVTRHFKYSDLCGCGNSKKRHNKYCAQCQERHVYTRIFDLPQAKHDRIRKRILIEMRGHGCEVCGLSSWMDKPIPIELDHIDGNADNNTETNLRLICPNCHAQTATYKGANAGKESSRQKQRRRRYAEGKTY